MSCCGRRKQEPISLGLPNKCCIGETGCSFDGNLRKVKAEPIYVQKVYDAALFNLQGLKTVTDQPFGPAIGRGNRIIRVLEIRCKKFFNPKDINDPANLVVKPKTLLSGAQFVEDGCGNPIRAVGPDGFKSEKLIFADTQDCDEKCKGTPIFGTQTLKVSGNVVVELDVVVSDDCDKECEVTLVGNINIACPSEPLVLTNFFELCIPSVFDSAFLPRFTEFCNIDCEPRLATNSILRDISVNPSTGSVRVNLIIALCITCEKKIIVPVQLCVLSTGFPQLEPEVSTICNEFPTLFPNQIDKDSVRECKKEKEREEREERKHRHHNDHDDFCCGQSDDLQADD
ncbi:hypothetical protein CLPU_3c03220 [Gottschalkia purinilytica]|uniref:Uncharacterized protein n=1 Tax=Gottschalkia purinilytica TaxID=1503 RepID=A0A0L0WDJ1_GOTPU|nr:hypothetical protein [Gottschalkia purinilytica]KNF09542.1 hypothetical protein CLPU_3c03220 [Gottschalkia purinilytica]